MPEMMARSATIQPIRHFQRSIHVQNRLEGPEVLRTVHILLEIG